MRVQHDDEQSHGVGIEQTVLPALNPIKLRVARLGWYISGCVWDPWLCTQRWSLGSRRGVGKGSGALIVMEPMVNQFDFRFFFFFGQGTGGN